MSTSVVDKLAVRQRQVGLVAKNMKYIAIVLEEKYGVKAIPLIDSTHDECQLVLLPMGEPVGTTYYYDIQEMLKVDVELEAAQLRDFLDRVPASIRVVKRKFPNLAVSPQDVPARIGQPKLL